jgi:hypothetical protein
MITIDCPLCDGDATTDDHLTAVTCDACGVTVDVAADAVTELAAVA